ncbi:MAG: Hsp70 family protein [Alphaproteobacteria bacterium]|nr:Hsp70 family protein [Alphaproteobacteria bacterium]
MNAETIIGIDLGTTNSEVAIVRNGRPEVVREGGEALLPSCVGVDEAGAIIVGQQARNQWAAAPDRTVVSVKRLMGSAEPIAMGSGTYLPQEISAFILKALRERASRALGHDVGRAVITVPAYFTDVQRQSTREAGAIAGLDVVRIINEPTAAALSYEGGGEDTRKVLVYDLGGGTFDVSVVQIEDGVVEVLSSTGDNHLGGDDFDQIIVDRLNQELKDMGKAEVGDDRVVQARLRRAAEQAKIELSDQPYVRIEEDHVAVIDGEAKHLSLELDQAEFEHGIDELLSKTMRSVTMALNDADVRPSQLDRVLLVGGSTRIPRVTRLLAERLGQEPHGEIDPDLCVALGAGVQAGMEMGLDMEAVLVDVTPYTFGTSMVGELYGQPYTHQFVPLIRRNSRLPASRTEPFFKMFEEQHSVEFKIYQGEDPDALKNVEIGSFLFEGLLQSEAAYEQGLLCTYHLDLDGLLKIHLVERATGREINGVVENALNDRDAIEASRQRLETLWQPLADASVSSDADAASGTASEAMEDTLMRATRILDDASTADREEISALIAQARNAVSERRSDDAEMIRQNLDEILFYLE